MLTTTLRLLIASTLLAACGKVGDTVDASVIDAPPPSGDATVITQAALFGGTIGARVGDIDIVSSMPDTTVLATAKTDANGGATIKVYPGGSVTAVYKHTVDMGADLITWVGVKPGDTLTFGSRSFSTLYHPNPTLGVQTYSWPALEGASYYWVRTSCGYSRVPSASVSIIAYESATCHKEPMDVVFGAEDALGSVLAVGFLSNRAFVDKGTVALPAWNTARPRAAINITGLPTYVTRVSGYFQSVFDTTGVESTGPGASIAAPTGGAYSGAFDWMPMGERTVGEVTLSRAGFGMMQIYDSFSLNTLTQTVAAPALPPWAQGLPIVSSALRSARWVLVSDAASVQDGQLLRVWWTRRIGEVSHETQWHFILPPGQMSITFPTLPALLGDLQPVPEDVLSATARAFELPAVTDYDMLRTLPSANIMCLECSVRAGDFQRAIFTRL